MTEEVLFETEQTLDRAAIADYLHTVADNLDAGEDVTLSAGGETLTMSPPARSEFEVKAEREGTELSLEFELEWEEGAGDDGETGGGLEIN
jgi:amphi-Trp domain-containing protein